MLDVGSVICVRTIGIISAGGSYTLINSQVRAKIVLLVFLVPIALM